MLDIIKKLLNNQSSVETETTEKPTEIKIEPKKPVERKKKSKPPVIKSQKDIATEKHEPYVNIIKVDLDPENIGAGSFELDWNEYFIAKLIRAGYKGEDDAKIVDQWFQDVCRNVVLETFEQYEANNPRPSSGVLRRDIGSGRSEIS
jgi:hypothetical protein